MTWAAAGAVAVSWALGFVTGPVAVATPVVASTPVIEPDAERIAAVLGSRVGEAVPAIADARLALVGVVTHGARGVALVAVDGAAARPVRVGAEVGQGWRLRVVHPRSVVLEDAAGGRRELALPARPGA